MNCHLQQWSYLLPDSLKVLLFYLQPRVSLVKVQSRRSEYPSEDNSLSSDQEWGTEGDTNTYTVYNLPTLLNKLWQISLSVTDGRHCKALCDEQFWQIEGNGGKCRHIEWKM